MFRAFRRDLDKAISVGHPRYERFFEALGGAVATVYLEATKQATPEDAELVARLLQSFEFNPVMDVFTTETVRYYSMVGELTYGSVSQRLGMELAFNIDDPMASRILSEGGRRAGLIDLAGQTREALFDALVEGREAGEGAVDLAKRIRRYVGAGPFRQAGASYRALLVARTEAKYAQNVASIAAYRESQAVVGLVAFDNQGRHNDDQCVARNGIVVSFEEAESLTGAEHPNGTLSWAPHTGPAAGPFAGA